MLTGGVLDAASRCGGGDAVPEGIRHNTRIPESSECEEGVTYMNGTSCQKCNESNMFVTVGNVQPGLHLHGLNVKRATCCPQCHFTSGRANE